MVLPLYSAQSKPTPASIELCRHTNYSRHGPNPRLHLSNCADTQTILGTVQTHACIYRTVPTHKLFSARSKPTPASIELCRHTNYIRPGPNPRLHLSNCANTQTIFGPVQTTPASIELCQHTNYSRHGPNPRLHLSNCANTQTILGTVQTHACVYRTVPTHKLFSARSKPTPASIELCQHTNYSRHGPNPRLHLSNCANTQTNCHNY